MWNLSPALFFSHLVSSRNNQCLLFALELVWIPKADCVYIPFFNLTGAVIYTPILTCPFLLLFSFLVYLSIEFLILFCGCTAFQRVDICFIGPVPCWWSRCCITHCHCVHVCMGCTYPGEVPRCRTVGSEGYLGFWWYNGVIQRGEYSQQQCRTVPIFTSLLTVSNHILVSLPIRVIER